MAARKLAHILAAIALAWTGAAAARQAPAPEVIPLYQGAPPGTEDWSGPETSQTIRIPGVPELLMVGNVTRPTLTVYRPVPGKANGTAVVILPGGGFTSLAVTHEGEMVARWLAGRGITAFMVKYRVRPIPGFRMPADLRKHPERFAEFAASFEPGRPIAIADAIQAMRIVRSGASRFGIAPGRIGMMGFSAGAIATMGVVMEAAPEDRPNFAAPIYGAMEDKAPPKDAPPLFLAVTQDDAAVPAAETLKIYSRWTEAGLPAELHLYEKGGHGFGMMRRGLPVDAWTSAFEAWLKSHGWLDAPKAR